MGKSKNTAKVPLASVIVPTKNEEANIANCLKSIKRQTYPNIEIIVVDNHSDDNTKKVAKKFTSKVYDKGPERSAQRNYGVQKSKGKYVLYLDADMILTPDVVDECVRLCEDEGYAGLYIPERIIGKGYWIKVRDFERSFYNGTVVDSIRFTSKEAYLKNGGFDSNLIACEDWDFDRRLKKFGKFGIIKTNLFHNERSLNLKQYLAKKSFYVNDLKRNYQKKWGMNDTLIKKQFSAQYRLLGVFIENGKFLKLFSHPCLALGMFYLRLRVGLNYILFT